VPLRGEARRDTYVNLEAVPVQCFPIWPKSIGMKPLSGLPLWD